MNFDVTVNGRPWRVAVEPAEERGRFHVSVKGRRRVFDASWIDAETLSLIAADASRRVQEVGVRSVEGGQLQVVLATKSFRVTAVAEGQSGSARRAETVSGGRDGRQTIVASMPGRVVRLIVSAGDRVSAGQAVVVVEAMKMENEMRSPKDGIVREVNIEEGAAVEAGTVLVVIE
jgi:biotin carboxyl carrier protein